MNPYEGFKPTVPVGATLETATEAGCKAFDSFEALGMENIAGACFTMVAGGLGERLGYNGIKIELPSEITTETCYLELYVKNILAFQARARKVTGKADLLLPLAIMTSGDTDEKTRLLLDANDWFGMEKSQLTIVKQELVPALTNNSAHFAMSDPFTIEVKPHGHGDVHTLLYQSGLASKWAEEGRTYLCFFQDTNGAVFRALPAAIGVSVSKNLAVNSLTVPRKPGEAVGAICKLEGATKSMTINVEYNQLDPLMKASGIEDKVDPATGFSPFPGNINVLVFDVKAYAVELKKTEGVISEFVNPKYADKEKTQFKKPTRLECMMQDYPKLLAPEVPVGFSQFERWTSFSAVKNNVKDAAAKQKDTGIAESGATGEADCYMCNRKLLKAAGVDVNVEAKEVEYSGIKVQEGAKVVLAPSFGVTRAEIKSKITGKVSISDASTLVLDGDITIKDLNLDGTLVVKVAPGASLVIESLKISNKGWSFLPNSAGASLAEKYLIRGYTLQKSEQAEISVASGSKSLSDELTGSVCKSL